MREKRNLSAKRRGLSLFLSIVLVFCVLLAIVFGVARITSKKMSDSAVQNLSESLDLIRNTIEAILRNEAEFQVLLAQEIAQMEDPEAYVLAFEKNRAMTKLSLVWAGQAEGVSSTGDTFCPDELDFSAGRTVNGLEISQSYVNYMGAWSYTVRCPVERGGQQAGALYAEYIYDEIDKALPSAGFYNQQATLYIMDSGSERFVLKPSGMGQRDAGHLNLDDFYRANNIQDEGLRQEVRECLSTGRNAMFYHSIRGVHALNYMWAVNGGTVFLVGYVPVEAIQQEGRAVNQSIFIVVVSMLIAFLACILLYYLNWRQQDRQRREREEERRVHSQQLAEALQAAQIASESKTTFLSNMSHDIRTPMNAVLGFTALLARDAENPAKVREYTRKITASGQHLLSLINDVLDVSKIESGKVVLNYERFALDDVVSSVEAIIQPMAKGRGQEFHVEVTGIRYEYLMGDETRLNQILINLLSNAVKYTQEGGKIWFRIIGLAQRSSQYERIRIEVEDNGYGMTPEYLKTIFDAFTRAENSTTNKVQGTGLGMAITKSIVEMMGGTIEVSSEVGRGSLFRVELELRIPEEQASREFWVQHGIARMLLVTADAECGENIRMLTEDTGVEIVLCASAQQAAGYLAKAGAECQVILLDGGTQEPGPDGAVALLQEAKPPLTPLVLLLDPNDNEPGGGPLPERTGVLPKPFFVSALQKKLAELLTDARQAELPGPAG